MTAVAKRSTLRPYPLDIIDGRDHVDALSNALATFGRSVRKAIEELAELGDADTTDLFTEISRKTDKNCGWWRHTCKPIADREGGSRARFPQILKG